MEGLLKHCHFGSEPCFHWCAKFSWLQTCFQTSLCPPYPSFTKCFWPCYTRLNWRLCNFDVQWMHIRTYLFIKSGLLASFRKGMTKTNTFKWCLYPQLFTYHNLFKNISHCWHICAFIFHITNDFVSKLVLLKRILQLANKTNSTSPFCFKQTKCHMFWFS